MGTVSRVLNGHDSVKPTIREQVARAIADLGYTPNAVAQSMRSHATQTVGCVIRDISSPALASFVQSAHEALHAAGYTLALTNSEGDRDREFELISLLSRRQTDGLIIAQYSEQDIQLESLLREAAMPIVLFDREVPEWCDAVMVDHRGAIRKATNHLLQLGHRRIALLTGKLSLYPARERLAGYKEAHQQWGVSWDEKLICLGSFLPDFALQQTSGLLAANDRPTAIIAGGMSMLPGVLRGIRVRGLEIPRDISLIASSDTDLAQLATPSVSVERWDFAEVARIAVSLLVDRINGRAPHEPRHVLMPTEYIARDSCGPPRALG